VAESNREFVELLRAKGVAAVWEDATEPEVLIQAHIKDARALVIATPETVRVRNMVETARTLNPPSSVSVRSHSADEAKRLEKGGAGTVFVGESELAKSMVGFVLSVVTSVGSATEL
jgi:monovalent cation:H+ antiporter-2, CPA2 family